MASTSQPQPNGVPSSSAAGPSQSGSQPTQNTATSGTTTVQNTQATNSSTNNTATQPGAANAAPQQQQQTPSSPTPSHAPRPRDARTIELLLTSQGVTSFDQRVPLLLLDFAYRHASSVLSDAIHLSTDPYTSHAGSKPSGSSGAAPSAPGVTDAVVSPNAINLAIASRQSFQFRGGAGGAAGGGGASKDWLQELARERNKVALPRVLANEWGVRLPNERFVLGGQGWGLKDHWEGEGGDDSEDEDMEEDGSGKKDGNASGAGGAAEGTQEGEGEGGGLDELLGDDMVDEDMEGME
ncbi:TFIID-31kDa-domain-containing protein [Annulohypoxylon truncatum]|uniref:TFIID-31kDa-domain-containing protein n=1 Tax=Annulohypoxylon truncatum TaxID=327061 RepID=UPI002007CA57|nr:TFIID-31kDa-domain-containing protein [Annulohypoxylon truncatum]KAI1209256.1 TFIID-31kDa-domain-containing protein [Annulohypoxylon truncatum]